MKHSRYFLVAISTVCLALGGTDPFVGKWTLNVQKSKYAAGTCPKRMIIEMDAEGDGVRYRSETITASGASSSAKYAAAYDGREVIVMGANGMMTPVALKRETPSVVVASYVRGQQVVATSRREVSKDGRWMTVTTTSKDGSGKSVVNVGVYERAASK